MSEQEPSVIMTDGALVKGMLSSSDVGYLKTMAGRFSVFYDEQSEAGECPQDQISKVMIFMWNRILALQKNQGCSQEEQASSYVSIADVWIKMGFHDRAAGQLKKALEMTPDSVEALQQLGDVYCRCGKFDAAIESGNKAIELMTARQEEKYGRTRLASAHSHLARIYQTKGEFKQAMAVLYKATESLELQSHEEEKSLKCASTDTIKDAQDAAAVYEHLGTLCETMGEYNEAVAALQKAHNILVAYMGEKDPKAQEIAYLIEMSSTLALQG